MGMRRRRYAFPFFAIAPRQYLVTLSSQPSVAAKIEQQEVQRNGKSDKPREANDSRALHPAA
jgi:hypothetical protein